MSWGPELRRELVELFREEYERGRDPRRLKWSHLGMREGFWQAEPFRLGSLELRVLETLTVERRFRQAFLRCAKGGEADGNAVKLRRRLERLGLVRTWPGEKRRERLAEITQRGWRVLLGKERARR